MVLWLINPPPGVCFHVFFIYLHMKVLATLGNHNRTRGVITWRFVQGEDDTCFAARNDGRRYVHRHLGHAARLQTTP